VNNHNDSLSERYEAVYCTVLAVTQVRISFRNLQTKPIKSSVILHALQYY